MLSPGTRKTFPGRPSINQKTMRRRPTPIDIFSNELNICVDEDGNPATPSTDSPSKTSPMTDPETTMMMDDLSIPSLRRESATPRPRHRLLRTGSDQDLLRLACQMLRFLDQTERESKQQEDSESGLPPSTVPTESTATGDTSPVWRIASQDVSTSSREEKKEVPCTSNSPFDSRTRSQWRPPRRAFMYPTHTLKESETGKTPCATAKRKRHESKDHGQSEESTKDQENAQTKPSSHQQ